MDVCVKHQLEPREAARRILAAAAELELEAIESEEHDGLQGAFRKSTPMGAVAASWKATEGAVEVQIIEKPAFLPKGSVTRLLEDGLEKALAKG